MSSIYNRSACVYFLNEQTHSTGRRALGSEESSSDFLLTSHWLASCCGQPQASAELACQGKLSSVNKQWKWFQLVCFWFSPHPNLLASIVNRRSPDQSMESDRSLNWRLAEDSGTICAASSVIHSFNFNRWATTTDFGCSWINLWFMVHLIVGINRRSVGDTSWIEAARDTRYCSLVVIAVN